MSEPILLDMTQAAQRLGIERGMFARNWRAWGIKSVRLGHRTVRFHVGDLDAWAGKASKRRAA